MQTQFSPRLLATAQGQEADRILRACVHCGFCTATCPTYQLLGDELDGPRGRIYLIKNLLEGEAASRHTQVHLDRCLTCRNCETTCPSGVEYHKLLEIGRDRLEVSQPRPLPERLLRWGLRQVLPELRRLRPVLPTGGRARQTPSSGRQVILLDNCVEPLLTPATVGAIERMLAALGIDALRPRGAGCCGAIDAHLSAPEAARARMRRNIDAWLPAIDAGAEAILITASGCGAMVKDYGWALREDPDYATAAARVAALARDPSEFFTPEELARFTPQGPRRIAFHPPCTLQHGQGLAGRVEALLRAAGFELRPVADSHSCCGSAGTYSMLQAQLARALRARKLSALRAGQPQRIVTANVGCQTHLQAGTGIPVVHWLELFDPLRTRNQSE